MMNLYDNTWEDQKGTIWPLKRLVQQHLINIEAMLKDIISGRRGAPAGCEQSIWELKASLRLIQAEIDRRDVDQDVKSEPAKITVTTIKLPKGTTGYDAYMAIGGLSWNAELVQSVELVFEIQQ